MRMLVWFLFVVFVAIPTTILSWVIAPVAFFVFQLYMRTSKAVLIIANWIDEED